MATNEMYEGMEIIHLEDFSNVVNINGHVVPRGGSATGTYGVISSGDQSSNAVLSTIANVCFGQSGTDSYNTQAGELCYSPRVTSKDGLLKMSCYRTAAGTLYYNGRSYMRSVPAIGLQFEYPSKHSDKRVILSMDYVPIDGSFTTSGSSVMSSRIVIQSTVNAGNINSVSELVGFNNRHLSGKLEFVFESGRLKVYFRNKLIGDVPHTLRTVFLGDVMYIPSGSSVGPGWNTFPLTHTPFGISNLVMVAVPLDSPMKRLGNIRVQRSLVNELDGSPHTTLDALNGTTTDDSKSLDVDHNVNTVKFESIELGDGEAVMGTQMCFSGTNTETGSTLETVVFDGEEELSKANHSLSETHRSRIVIGDYLRGDVPEDYSEVHLKVRSVEV